MPVPFKAVYDRYAQVTFGLDALGIYAQPRVNGVALVTEFIFAEDWGYCADPVVTVWTACSTAPVTVWSAAYVQPVTVWTLIP